MSLIVVLTVIVIALLITVLAIYLAWVGALLSRISNNLIDSNNSVKSIIEDAELIKPAVDHINRTGGVVAGALPLLYGHGERILAKTRAAAAPKAAPRPREGSVPGRGGAAQPGAVSRRRSRLTEAVGYRSGG